VEHRLDAILAADVAGYSRMMAVNESVTLAESQRHRSEVLQPAIARHHGRVVKLMGDGILAEFSSIVEAVDCAVEVQRDMAQRNNAIPDDVRIAFRTVRRGCRRQSAGPFRWARAHRRERASPGSARRPVTT
jgi:adenylate cyclase